MKGAQGQAPGLCSIAPAPEPAPLLSVGGRGSAQEKFLVFPCLATVRKENMSELWWVGVRAEDRSHGVGKRVAL